ncbi:Pyruvate/Phosphoenolpyruvate kinase-like domain-containing protein [Dunaliella salina]|uniref:Pyruvate/Phosphoenolpyruvate kinase-like domain-containing protein n=1 Tax=Dunaliella salina TaxID=3046 RepID=A0ABQ7GHL1_DUNSA|nr:Pyruvate/Phosphoenolpyruvate kinase-like domain-containing protein [Dunaliella salina]|eukprot:KAF5834096.1 Pyruvate/Phosphoenolpyruvate kinase-like domain-containing protein [Dunaliella salina]
MHLHLLSRIPGVYDALSAKVLERAGHKAGFVSGYAVSATLLGEPDIGLLTPPEMARKSSQICTAVPQIPVIADADTGGGNVLNVSRTIRQLINAGCKGAIMEDQQWPKRAGHMRNKECIAMEEFASKVAAAREVIGTSDFFLVARTDARATSAKHGLEDAITRANLYMEVGADASFVEAPRSDEELIEIGKSTKGIRVCNMLEGGFTPIHTPRELRDMGYSLVLYPLAGLYSATRALMNVYGTLGTKGTTRDDMQSLAHFSEFNDIIGLEQAIDTEERLTRRESGDKLSVRVRAPTKAAS